MAELILAIDQGTTGTTVLLFDARGRVKARTYQEIRQYYPKPGWVEHDPEEIYRSVVAMSRKAIRLARADAGDVRAIGIANQRETFVLWERKSGRPVGRAIVWQCRRSSEICKNLREREAEVTERTGLLLDPYFSGTKVKWLLDREPGLRARASRGELGFGTIETWLVYKLSRGEEFVSDFTNASRTMLMNLERREWDPQMLEMLGVPHQMLPTLVSSRGPIAEAASGTIGGRAIPIGAIIGDQQAALYGQGAVAPREGKTTYGTGAFMLMHTGARRVASKNRLLTSSALGPIGEAAYALEGSIFVAGAAIQWLRDEIGLMKGASESAAMARRSRNSEVYMVPAFVGLGAPYWDSSARAALLGLTRGSNRNDIARAALDSIAYQVVDVVAAMESDIGERHGVFRADGGATANGYLMQFQADLIGHPVRVARIADTTALGAALLGGLAVGVWKSAKELASLRGVGKIYNPKMRAEEREKLMAGWHAAVSRVLTR
jgi:glycerol kinase